MATSAVRVASVRRSPVVVVRVVLVAAQAVDPVVAQAVVPVAVPAAAVPVVAVLAGNTPDPVVPAVAVPVVAARVNLVAVRIAAHVIRTRPLVSAPTAVVVVVRKAHRRSWSSRVRMHPHPRQRRRRPHLKQHRRQHLAPRPTTADRRILNA